MKSRAAANTQPGWTFRPNSITAPFSLMFATFAIHSIRFSGRVPAFGSVTIRSHKNGWQQARTPTKLIAVCLERGLLVGQAEPQRCFGEDHGDLLVLLSVDSGHVWTTHSDLVAWTLHVYNHKCAALRCHRTRCSQRCNMPTLPRCVVSCIQDMSLACIVHVSRRISGTLATMH